jgi:hypothetical protein
MTPRTVIPYAPKEKMTGAEPDTVDQAGSAILDFIKRAGETTETELQEARRAAEYLADQLRAAHDQINDLKGRGQTPSSSGRSCRKMAASNFVGDRGKIFAHERKSLLPWARLFANEQMIGDRLDCSFGLAAHGRMAQNDSGDGI